MPHIRLPKDLPGISSGFAFRPETAKPMRELAHILLHEPNSLTPGERELIVAFVSSRNDCYFCIGRKMRLAVPSAPVVTVTVSVVGS